MLLHIKNMVCDRCILVVRQQMESLGFSISQISLGQVDIQPDADDNDLLKIASTLNQFGFDLIDNEKDKIIGQIKNIVIESIRHNKNRNATHVNFSDLIADALNKDYGYLSRLFSESEDMTLAKFIIAQKVEKVKELLQDGELNINQIALDMGYSSSAHLSAQFKQITGLTPSQYKTSPAIARKPLDKV